MVLRDVPARAGRGLPVLLSPLDLGVTGDFLSRASDVWLLLGPPSSNTGFLFRLALAHGGTGTRHPLIRHGKGFSRLHWRLVKHFT